MLTARSSVLTADRTDPILPPSHQPDGRPDASSPRPPARARQGLPQVRSRTGIRPGQHKVPSEVTPLDGRRAGDRRRVPQASTTTSGSRPRDGACCRGSATGSMKARSTSGRTRRSICRDEARPHRRVRDARSAAARCTSPRCSTCAAARARSSRSTSTADAGPAEAIPRITYVVGSSTSTPTSSPASGPAPPASGRW